jgi:hypothetical protein
MDLITNEQRKYFKWKEWAKFCFRLVILTKKIPLQLLERDTSCDVMVKLYVRKR